LNCGVSQTLPFQSFLSSCGLVVPEFAKSKSPQTAGFSCFASPPENCPNSPNASLPISP